MTYRKSPNLTMLPSTKKGGPRRVVFSSDKPSKTLAVSPGETDINLIVQRFQASGLTPAEIARMAGNPQYGDQVGSPDLATVLQRQLDGNRAWAGLPDVVRRLVGSPDNLVPWLKDPDNTALAVKHGLLVPRPQVAGSPAPAAAPSTSTPTGASSPSPSPSPSSKPTT